ncbi:hypothetical protein ASPVEDRAFT_370587 [Aspergillus versicolor CBS 583.65]|uniref:Uncharacterized protein n=1 Tax=Aspergillus versicolor CBS 583.65 TaxID=1036611 RepID=A0A1L9Q1E3_ASPVE|nr:uncharacterized protein ASPVEDRAFT_370587 [Aspergillus versicolor CBS 583.65]OJJ07570.1 hypothetical protein ASPVEDRAFT_370587 [Aspergillus versicolor CBS 583.65]
MRTCLCHNAFRHVRLSSAVSGFVSFLVFASVDLKLLGVFYVGQSETSFIKETETESRYTHNLGSWTRSRFSSSIIIVRPCSSRFLISLNGLLILRSTRSELKLHPPFCPTRAQPRVYCSCNCFCIPCQGSCLSCSSARPLSCRSGSATPSSLSWTSRTKTSPLDRHDCHSCQLIRVRC